MIQWKQFSKKQLQLLTWWMPKSTQNHKIGIICEGAVRAGKTIVMGLSYVIWAMETGTNHNYIIGGKTVGSLRRNVVTPLTQALRNRGYNVHDSKTENLLIISKGEVVNSFYLFGGRDERSQDLVQGITARGIMLDEVALMPRSFVEQCMARCSDEGAKYWFNCNPEGPQHWFYVEHVKQYKEKNYYKLHFSLYDNPSLSDETRHRYENMFSGIFYRRFILGEWAFADGVIYDCYTEEKNTYRHADREKVLPIEILENDPNGGYPFYASDYGVLNPMVYLEMYKIRKPGERVPYFYVDNEYYYDGRATMKQKTDEEEVEALINLIDGKYYQSLIIDPSASSLIAAGNKNGIAVRKAKNDVLEGIHLVYTLLATGHILINKDRCPHLISELGLYIWNEKRGEIGKEEPVKNNDHCCDALRYGIASTTARYEVFEGIERKRQ